MSTTRTERHDERRARLVDDSARVFARRGYHNTTMDELVEETGLTRGGLYHYISGKKDLLVASHQRYLHPLLAEASRIEAQDLPPSEALRLIVGAMMRTHADYPDHVAVFLREWPAIADEPEWTSLRSERRRFEAILSRILERGRVRGDFAFEDASATLFALLGMVNYSPQWFKPAGRLSADALAERFTQIFLHGIRRPAL